MIAYQCKNSKIAGTDFKEVARKARLFFHSIESRTKRQPYIRSAYFDKEKIFLNYFWPHLDQKSRRERLKRLVYLSCAIELIEYSRAKPTSKIDPNQKDELFHRFTGLTKKKELFYVQIKEDLKSKKKYLMSVFPPE